MPAPRDDEGVPDLGRRLQEVVVVIEELAALRFDARATVGMAGDIVDAVAAGVNALGEASRRPTARSSGAWRTARPSWPSPPPSSAAGRCTTRSPGSLNRAAFWDRLGHRLEAPGRAASVAVLFLDLDDFKFVNDNYGHAAGDQPLIEVAHRIKGELRPSDTARARGWGRVPRPARRRRDGDDALAVAARVNARLCEPHRFGPHTRMVTGSIGMALSSGCLTTCDALVAAADAAMYDAKRAGGGRCVLHREEAG